MTGRSEAQPWRVFLPTKAVVRPLFPFKVTGTLEQRGLSAGSILYHGGYPLRLEPLFLFHRMILIDGCSQHFHLTLFIPFRTGRILMSCELLYHTNIMTLR